MTEVPEPSIKRASGAANADAAPSPRPAQHDHDPHAAPYRETSPAEDADQIADKDEAAAGDRQDALLDEGVEETFPASDPVSVKRIT